ncbi:hypothetical protein Tco_0278607 [Tanacetum coccineum]
MSTYLKNMAGYKHNQIKNKSFDDIQKLFDKSMKRVNSFIDMDTELVEGSESTKKQKVDDDKETTELKNIIEVMPNQEEVALNVIPLIVKSPSIVNWKIHKEGKKTSRRPVEDLDLVLYGDFKTMFEPHVEDNVWKNQSYYRVLDCFWTLEPDQTFIAPSSKSISDWKLLIHVVYNSLRKQNGRIFGIKRLLDDLGVTAAKSKVSTAGED